MATEITTQIIIQASPANVWQVLTDYAAYPAWNPFIKSLTGTPEVGKKIKVEFEQMTFTPEVLTFEKEKEFKWIGHLFFTGLFDGQHRFQLIDNGNGSTTLIHGEIFKGILVPLFKKKLIPETKANFESMNQALKARVEGLVA